jgi:hypothetical protein
MLTVLLLMVIPGFGQTAMAADQSDACEEAEQYVADFAEAMAEFRATPVAGMNDFGAAAMWMRENEPPEVLQEVLPALIEFFDLYSDVGTMVEMANSGELEEWGDDWEERYGPAWEDLEAACPDFTSEDILEPTVMTPATPEP